MLNRVWAYHTSLTHTGRWLGSEAGLPRGHRVTLSRGASSSLFPLLGHLSLPTGFLSTPARTPPRDQNYSGPFSCRMHCQLTQSLEFHHSSQDERSTSEPHQLANTGLLELAVLRTGLQPTQVTWSQDVLGGPEVKSPPSNTGDVGSILGWGTKITYGGKGLSPWTSVIEPAHQN